MALKGFCSTEARSVLPRPALGCVSFSPCSEGRKRGGRRLPPFWVTSCCRGGPFQGAVRGSKLAAGPGHPSCTPRRARIGWWAGLGGSSPLQGGGLTGRSAAPLGWQTGKLTDCHLQHPVPLPTPPLYPGSVEEKDYPPSLSSRSRPLIPGETEGACALQAAPFNFGGLESTLRYLMTMGHWPGMPLLLILLVCSLAPARANPTKKNPTTKSPQSDSDLSLEDALNGGSDDFVKPNPPKPKPDHHGDTGGFSDDDLNGHAQSGGSDDRSNDENAAADSPGAIPGIISGVLVAVVGAVTSFIAYQKKKLCFKGNEDPENVNMESHHGANTEPPVQRTLIEK
ncbi:uncharacterized protein LOC141504772 [Macrotis lagotis]|uniref:uncharacterized protein LOC141504772 n=1 Tax=Macrotis lagotis TaxID=92651 RepID=UPI003D68077C